MAIIVSIETATPICSVAIHKDGNLLAETSVRKGHSHSSLLNSSIQNLLELSEVKMDELSAIAVSKGPGSYTGLRIGTSTAKGLCYALDIPLISVDTLKAMAYAVRNYNNWNLCPMLDARRMEVYCSIFDSEMNAIEPIRPVVLDDTSFIKELDATDILFFGDGSEKFSKVMFHKNAHFVNDVEPNAKAIGELAFKKYTTDQFEDVAYFEPFYLKEFLATKPKSIL